MATATSSDTATVRHFTGLLKQLPPMPSPYTSPGPNEWRTLMRVANSQLDRFPPHYLPRAKQILRRRPILLSILRPRSLLTLTATEMNSSHYAHNVESHLFGLPPELRNRIYEYVVEEIRGADFGAGTPILRVCVQMYRVTTAMVAPRKAMFELEQLWKAALTKYDVDDCSDAVRERVLELEEEIDKRCRRSIGLLG